MKARKLLDKEEFDYDHFTRLTSTGIKADYNTIAQFAETYHQEQLKLLNIDNVRLCFSEAVGEITSEGLECGIEDCNITDRYEAMQYGFEQCKERADEAILNVG